LTTHQLLEIYHTILTALDSKFFTSITFADVGKAFDRVWIEGLLLKLEGIKPDWNLYRSLFLCKWLKMFLNTIFSNILLTQDNNETGL
jgi:hypothetical protein